MKKSLLRFEQLANTGKPGWWRYVLFFLFLSGGSIILTIPFFTIILLRHFDYNALSVALQSNNSEAIQQVISSSLSNYSSVQLFSDSIDTVITVASVAVTFLLLYAGIKWIHYRPLLSLVTNRSNFDWRRMWSGFGAYMGIQLGIIVLAYLLAWQNHEPLNLVFTTQSFISWLSIAIIIFGLIGLQTAAEEILFRGYIFQAVYRSVEVMRNKFAPSLSVKNLGIVLAFLVSCGLFGAAHYQNGPFQAGFWVASTYFFTALFFQLVAYKDQRLELTIGLHFANNIIAFLILGSLLDGGSTPLFLDTSTAVANNTPYVLIPTILPMMIFYFLFFHSKRKYLLTKKNKTV